ncbi:MAG: VWA domain-containing protein [Gemmatimonadaceae bacterium]|nr:VWA domain-containing protein [Gemmatimonadaceae bacterium]
MRFPGGFEILNPEALLLLLVLPAWWIWRRRRAQHAIVFSRASVLAAGPRAGRLVPTLIFIARNVAIAAAIFALARPRTTGKVETITTQGINIILAIDISSSMLAQDFRPQNRIEVAKDRVKQFIAARKSDRIGVVAFSGEALTQVPLTTDYPVAIQAVNNLQAGQLEDGTAIGTAIATSANRLKDAPGKSRVLILLTDGVNNRGTIDPMTAAQAAAVYSVKIYTIGVGTEGMAPVPVGRGLFGLKFEMQPVQLDEVLLDRIARLTGGRYFRARDGAALTRIYDQINTLERVPVQSRTYVRNVEQYRWPLALAILALLLELGLVAWKAPIP